MCTRELSSKVKKLRISIGQGSALRTILFRPEYKRLKIVTASVKANSSKVPLKASQEPVERCLKGVYFKPP